jgi:hypothetical protein
MLRIGLFNLAMDVLHLHPLLIQKYPDNKCTGLQKTNNRLKIRFSQFEIHQTVGAFIEPLKFEINENHF